MQLSAGSPPLDGTLPSWSAVSRLARWGALLFGNGLSVHMWPGFAYRTLYEQARRGGGIGGAEQQLFAQFQTQNFELVLARLAVARAVATALGSDTTQIDSRRQKVQIALGAAIHAIHVKRTDLDDAALRNVKEAMLGYQVVFTTNYDLLTYWAMGVDEDFASLADGLWSDSVHGPCAFDPRRVSVHPGWTPIYYLHGALHLVVWPDGVVQKLRRSGIETLLEQFDRPRLGDGGSRPLLVTEGTAGEKRRAISENQYLSHAYKQLQSCRLPLVVFGSSLSVGDRHLADAINAAPDRAVAVSMLPGGEIQQRRAFQSAVRAQLHTPQLYFYDATTHPLGSCPAGLKRPTPLMRRTPATCSGTRSWGADLRPTAISRHG